MRPPFGPFPKVRTDRPDHSRTSHFDDENAFFQEFLLKHHFLRVCHLGSLWIVLIKSEIIIMTGIFWPVSFDKWKVPHRRDVGYMCL